MRGCRCDGCCAANLAYKRSQYPRKYKQLQERRRARKVAHEALMNRHRAEFNELYTRALNETRGQGVR